MNLSVTLLNDCEEFFEAIANEKSCPRLDRAIDGLRNFLERDVDGWTNHTDEIVARAAQCRLAEIWSLISREEKALNPDLEQYFENIEMELEEISGFETDGDEDGEYEEDVEADDDGSDV
jgi:hypothetical protein